MTVNLAPNPVSGPIPSGPKGDPGLVPAGEWAAGTYLANRMVRRFNCLFRSKRTTTQAPTFGVGDVVSSDDWELLIDGRGIELVTDNAQAAVQSATDAAASATEAQTYRDEMAPGEPGGTAQLDGGGVVPLEQIPASIRQKLGYKGGWDASTNTPAIPAASADNQGWYYVVAVAGSTTIDGISEWKVGDWIVSNGASWDRLEDTRVHTVAGRMGDVTLTSADLTDKGAPGGVAQLDGAGRMPVSQLPSAAQTTLANVAALRAFAPVAGMRVSTRGYSTDADGGESSYLAATGASAGTYVDNGAGVIVPTGGNGSTAWLLIRGKSISPYQCGGVGTGLVDDVGAVQKAIDLMAVMGGGEVDCSGGRWLIDSADLTVKAGVTLRGPWRNVGETDTHADYLTIRGALVVNPAYTIRLYEDFAATFGLVITRKGLTTPGNLRAALDCVAAFAGTAITIGDGTSKKASDTYVGYCFVLGFAQAYYNDYNERPRVEFLSGDCTSGVYMKRIYDMNHVRGCHFWEFITTHNSWSRTDYAVSSVANNGAGLIRVTLSGSPVLLTGDVIALRGVLGTVEANGRWTLTKISDGVYDLQGSTFTNAYTSGGTVGVNANRRSGTAYFFDTATDWGQASDCFAFGYDVGWKVNGSDHVTLVNCGSDNSSSMLDPDTIDFHIINADACKLVAPKAAAAGRGIVVDLQNPLKCTTLIAPDIWGGNRSAVHCVSGTTKILGASFQSFATGASPRGFIEIDDTAYSVVVVGCSSQSGAVDAYYASTAALRVIEAWGNSFQKSNASFIGQTISNNVAPSWNFDSYRADGGAPQITMRKARGTQLAPTIAQNGDQTSAIRGSFWDGAAFQLAGTCYLVALGAPSAGAVPSGWTWTTAPASGAPVNRLQLNENGHLYPVSDNAYSCGASGVRWSAIWAANGTIQTSDARAKKDVADASLGLAFIQSLRPVSYRWVEGGTEIVRQVYRDGQGNEIPEGEPIPDDAMPAEVITCTTPGGRTHWGLIAQEVKAAVDAAGVDFGGWVLSDKRDAQSQQALRYDQFIAPLIKAVQELATKVAALEAR